MSNKIRKVSFGVADATAADESESEASITAITEEVLMDDETQTITRPEFLLNVS